MALGNGTSHAAYTADAQQQINAVNDLKRVYSELAKQQEQEYERVAASQRDVNKGLADGKSEGNSLGSVLGKLKGQFAVLAGAAAAAAAAVKFVGDETARLDGIAKSAQKSGLGFEAYQRLSHVATLSGTSIEAVGKASLKLNVNLRDIAEGGGKQAARALGELGLEADALAGLSETEQFAAIAGQLSQVADESTKSALAFEIFGKSGTELVPMLNAGADGVRDMSDAVGRVFTREELAKAEAYQDALADLEKTANDAKGQLAVALAPALQEVAEKLTAAGAEAQKYLPALIRYLDGVIAGLEPIARYVGFFAEQVAVVGRVVEIVGDGVGGLVDQGRELIAESPIGEWASEASSEIDRLSAGAVADLTAKIEEHLPFATDVARTWDDITRAITGASAAASEMSAIAKAQQKIVGWIGLAKDTGDDLAEAREREVEALARGVTQAEFAVDLAEAQKQPAAELERLYREQHFARVQLLSATGDLAALEQEMAAEEIRRAAAGARRRGGGRGPSDADRMRAEGEAQLQQWEQRLRLAELEAEISGEAASQAVYLGRVRHGLAVQELELDRQVLEVTRAKNSVERQQNETKIAAINASIQELELEQQLAEQAMARAEAQEWRNEWAASVQAEAASLGHVVELEDYRLEQRARQLEQEGQLAEVYAIRVQQAQLRADQTQRELELRQQLILAEQPETEAERIRQAMDLEQVAHEQRMAIAQRDSERRRLTDAESKRLFEAEKARKQAGFKQAVQIAEQVAQVAQAGGELATFIANQTIKDEEKRQKVILRVQGGIAMALGAVEVAKAVSSFAALNIPQGLAHSAAAAIAFAKGGMMLAGQVPGAGGAGGGASAAPSAPREARSRDTSDSGITVPGSVPAADRGPQRLGGADPKAAGQGGTTININGDVAGSIDDAFAERLGRAIRDSRHGTEAA